MKTKILNFTKKVISMRKHIVSAGHSKKNPMLMLQTMQRLELQMQLVGTDLSAARFFERYKSEILLILPGKSSATGLALQKEYTTLLDKSINVIRNGSSQQQRAISA